MQRDHNHSTTFPLVKLPRNMFIVLFWGCSSHCSTVDDATSYCCTFSIVRCLFKGNCEHVLQSRRASAGLRQQRTTQGERCRRAQVLRCVHRRNVTGARCGEAHVFFVSSQSLSWEVVKDDRLETQLLRLLSAKLVLCHGDAQGNNEQICIDLWGLNCRHPCYPHREV